MNLEKFAYACLNPKEYNIQKIKFFTARVKKNADDPGKTTRQDLYLQAIQTLPNVEIVWGQFKKRTIKGFLCYSQGLETKQKVIVSKFEEKNSDVNIATDMIEDGYQNKYECAALISNDTDLVTPLLRIKYNLEKLVVVISPYGKVHVDLKKASHYSKGIKNNNIFQKSQFPLKLNVSGRAIHCPREWHH